MVTEVSRQQYVPLTCHGHSRPVMHINFSDVTQDGQYYLISACKDNNPMLRDGITGDWIGTFIKHKGAVWQARLSADADTAATASADFSVIIWDTHTGAEVCTIQHDHIVRAIAFPPGNASLIATGGMEKKLRIFDLSKSMSLNGSVATRNADSGTVMAAEGFEIGANVHKGSIKSIVWTHDPNILVTLADDKMIRWWDLAQGSGTVVQEQSVEGEIGSCEFTNVKPEENDIGGGLPVLTIAVGKTIYFYGGQSARNLLKKVVLPYEVVSVALHPGQRKYVTGGVKDTWARVYEYDSGREIDVHKGHHGPIWSISFSPDGKLYATGSEDGTIKLWKNCTGPYGLWRAD